MNVERSRGGGGAAASTRPSGTTCGCGAMCACPRGRAEPLAWWHEQFSSGVVVPRCLGPRRGKTSRGLSLGDARTLAADRTLAVTTIGFPADWRSSIPNYATREVAELLLDGLGRRTLPCCPSFATLAGNPISGGDFLAKRPRTVVGRLHQHSALRNRHRRSHSQLGNNWRPASRRTTGTRCARPGGAPSVKGEWTLEVQGIASGAGELDRNCCEWDLNWSDPAGRDERGPRSCNSPASLNSCCARASTLARDGQVRLAFSAARRTGDRVRVHLGGERESSPLRRSPTKRPSARLSPGQQLLHWTLRDLARAGVYRSVDYVGPMTESTRRCCTGSYTTGTIVLGQVGGVGQAGVWAYRMRRAWKNRSRVVTQGPTA
jgi:hypothetical protein